MEKFAFILMVTIVAYQNSDASFMASCEADHECPSSYFCYLETNYCAPCTDCQAKHRHNSTRSRCTKGYSECGQCLTGFQEEILTSGKPRELCVPVEKVEEDKKDVNILILAAMFLLVVLLMLTVTALIFIYARKISVRENRQIVVSESEEPPPYSSLTPVIENLGNIGVEHRLVDEVTVNERDRDRRNADGAPSTSGTASICEQSFACSWAETKEDNRLQEAVPFCQPTYVCQENLNTSDHDDSGVSELDSGSAEISPSWHADLHDDTTMPSEWVPNMISLSENREMELDEGACTETTSCERESDDVYMDAYSQVNQSADLVEQQHPSQQMLASSGSPHSESCN